MNLEVGQTLSKSMARLLVHVEGQTEETFVKEVLCPHLYGYGFQSVSARLIGNARQRTNRGGIRGWDSVSKEILNHLKEDTNCLATTMVDYYGLPKTGNGAWPGRESAGNVSSSQRAGVVQTAMFEDICNRIGNDFNHARFIPYVITHEFEGLLFSDCTQFAKGIGQLELAVEFQKIRDGFHTPEEINDSPATAPSKRVKLLVPGYEKPLFGALAVLEIGLNAIRAECPLFRRWLEQLEAYPKSV